MRQFNLFLIWAALAFGVLFMLTVIAVVFVKFNWMPGLFLLFVVGAYYGWLLFGYLHYRQGRQDEFQHLLTTAVQANLPLGPALWSYLRDRPRTLEREVFVAMLLFFVFPGYYWFWHRRHSFAAKISTAASHLDLGVSLGDSLRD